MEQILHALYHRIAIDDQCRLYVCMCSPALDRLEHRWRLHRLQVPRPRDLRQVRVLPNTLGLCGEVVAEQLRAFLGVVAAAVVILTAGVASARSLRGRALTSPRGNNGKDADPAKSLSPPR